MTPKETYKTAGSKKREDRVTRAYGTRGKSENTARHGVRPTPHKRLRRAAEGEPGNHSLHHINLDDGRRPPAA